MLKNFKKILPNGILKHPLAVTLVASGCIAISYAHFKLCFEQAQASLDAFRGNPAFPKPDNLLPAHLDRPDEKLLADQLAKPRNGTLYISGPSGSGKSTNVCHLLVRVPYSFYGSLRPIAGVETRDLLVLASSPAAPRTECGRRVYTGGFNPD